ncbi:hypothetical protein EVG20_g11401, partial [Dentipellis fragilis]
TLGRSLIVSALHAFLDILYGTSLLAVPTLESAAAEAQKVGFVWVEATPSLIVGEIKEKAAINKIEAVRTGGFWYGRDGAGAAAGKKAGPNEKIFYHMHGGGFVMGSAHPSNSSAVACFNSLLEHTGVSRIFALEYRISVAPPFGSEGPFPAALIDAIAGYRYLVQDVGFLPENIVSGDSAGGSLAHAVVRYFSLYNIPNLPVPGAFLALSPTVDWGCTHKGPGSSMERNSRSDFVHPIFTSGYTYRALQGNLPDDEIAQSPWVSPGSLSLASTKELFAGFPKTCIVSGGAEMTLDPMRTMKDRMESTIGSENVTYIEVAGSTHDILTQVWHEPERTETLKKIGAWIVSA